MNYRRRSFFTLLETLIALALTTLALSTLLFFYREMIFLNSQSDVLEKENFKLRYVENKFSSMFPRTLAESNKNFFFFTTQDAGGLFAPGSNQSLIFTHNQGVDLSKQFSNLVISQLYLDSAHRLCLASWPSPNRWVEGAVIPIKFQVLLEDVDAVKFWFFIAPDKKWSPTQSNATTNPQPNPPPAANTTQTPTTVVNPSPEGDWINYWSQDFKQLPAIIKIELKRKGKTEFYAFPLSHCKRQPIYTQ